MTLNLSVCRTVMLNLKALSTLGNAPYEICTVLTYPYSTIDTVNSSTLLL